MSAARFRYPLRQPEIVSARPIVIAIALASAILIALLWVAAVHTTQVYRGTLLDTARQDNQKRAVAYAHFVGTALDAADGAALYIAAQAHAVPPGAGGARPMLFSDPLFSDIDVTDARGAVVMSSDAAGPASLAATPAFRALAADPARGPVIDGPVAGGPPVMALSRPVRDAAGRFAGMVSVRFPAARLADFYGGVDLRPHDLISVIRLDGVTLARREGARVSYAQNLAGTRVMREQAARPDGTYIGPSALDGVERIFSHRRLARYGLFVTVGVGTDDVLALSYRRARVFYSVMASLTLTILVSALLLSLGLIRGERRMRNFAAINHRLSEAQRIGRMGDWELDVESGMLVCSDEACRMHGRDPADDVITAQQALAYHDKPGQAAIERAMRTAIVERSPQQVEVESRLGDGRLAHLRIRISPVVDADGRVRTVLGTEQDISGERRHESLRAQVAHLARVEAMNVMAATIAHELAQPLTAASNYLAAASHMAERGETRERDNLGVLLAQANRQIGLTSKIIGRAREMVSDRQFSEVSSLEEVVDDAIALSRVANPFARRAALVADLDPGTGHVAADKVQIQQVLLNLLRNGAEAASRAVEPRVVVSSKREPGGMVMICVSDNGPGIPDDAADIFSPFGSSKEAGLGLGLSICRTIVDSYGGRIWHERSALGGAAICFTLPLDELAMLYKVA